MCTFTMAGWGTPCPDAEGDNLMSTHPGCIFDHYFDGVYFCRIRFAGEPPVMEKLIKME